MDGHCAHWSCSPLAVGCGLDQSFYAFWIPFLLHCVLLQLRLLIVCKLILLSFLLWLGLPVKCVLDHGLTIHLYLSPRVCQHLLRRQEAETGHSKARAGHLSHG